MVGSIREIAERLRPVPLPVMVWAAHRADGWKVALTMKGTGAEAGQPGARGSTAELSSGDARKLAAELLDFAEICEGRRW